MPTLSSKRQVTLPKELCDRLGVMPGDDLDILDHNGRITLLKKRKGASAGVLGHIRAEAGITDEASLRDAVERRGSRARVGRVA